MTITIFVRPKVKRCEECNGKGYIPAPKPVMRVEPVDNRAITQCPECRGYGVPKEWVRAIVAWCEGGYVNAEEIERWLT